MFPLIGYILLFVAVGAGFILIHLLLGKLIRPDRPQGEKSTIYECGEPTIGSAWVQFDLRFYVVALLFVIFDVEVAFFFPWAVVFGKANTVAAGEGTVGQRTESAYVLAPQEQRQRDALVREKRETESNLIQKQRELARQRRERGKTDDEERAATIDEAILKLEKETASLEEAVTSLDSRRTQLDEKVLAHAEAHRDAARTLGWFALWDIVVFFGVLLVGFAYLWKRGDLQWVRSLTSETAAPLRSVQKSPQPAGTGF